MKEFKVRIEEPFKKRDFIVEAVDEQQAELKAYKLFEKQDVSLAFNTREL